MGGRGKRRGRHASPDAEEGDARNGQRSVPEDQRKDTADSDDVTDPPHHKERLDDEVPIAAEKEGRSRRGRRRGRTESSDGLSEPQDAGQEQCHASDAHGRNSTENGNEPAHRGKKHGNKGEKPGADKPAKDITMLVSFKCHHGKHVAAQPNGDLKAKSSVIGDPEKFELVKHADGLVSYKTCHGTYITADRSGDLKATCTTIGDNEKFALTEHPDGTVSLRTHRGFFVAAVKSEMKANRATAGAWEKFQLKIRQQSENKLVKACKEGEDGAEKGLDKINACPIPLFDACCELEAVLLAEERYAKTHADKVAVQFEKRSRARRAQGLELSFSHFRKEHDYPASFQGCVSAWDATAIHFPGAVESSDDGVKRADAWEVILAEGREDLSDGVCNGSVFAAFGIPATSAAEADEIAFERLRSLCEMPQCIAVGPVTLDVAELPTTATPKKEHEGLNAAGITAEFGVAPPFHTTPNAVYDAKRDPMCVRWLSACGDDVGSWIAEHGDRRLSEFEAACADYAQRRSSVQKTVAERQVRLAKELGKTLIVQLPPQDEAERCMADLLVAVLQDSDHPVLLSAFRGRPKCAAALLKHLPGVMIGFSGLLTHSKLKDTLGEVAFDVPLNRLVLESLGPRYAPAVLGIGDARGSFSHPAHIAVVAAELAKVKGMQTNEVLEAAWTNATKRLFRLPEAPMAARKSDDPEDANRSTCD